MKCCFLLFESFRVVLNVQLQCVINQASSQTPRPNCSCSYRSSTYICIYIHINIHALPVIHNHIAYVFVHVLNIKNLQSPSPVHGPGLLLLGVILQVVTGCQSPFASQHVLSSVGCLYFCWLKYPQLVGIPFFFLHIPMSLGSPFFVKS